VKTSYERWIARYLERFTCPAATLGRCREASVEIARAFPELRVVRGHVRCAWGRRGHWWTVTPDGEIVDPTAAQFTCGIDAYEEYRPGHTARSCAIATRRARVVPAVEPGGDWHAPGENLRGVYFGEWVVEDPAPQDERGLRCWVRCACGVRGVRHVADLARGAARPCRSCSAVEEEVLVIDEAVAAEPLDPPRPSERVEPRKTPRPHEHRDEERLALAIEVVRSDAAGTCAPEDLAFAWREIDGYVRTRYPARGEADREEAQQETLATLLRCIPQIRATDAVSLAVFVHKVWSSRRIDVHRAYHRSHGPGRRFSLSEHTLDLATAEELPVLCADPRHLAEMLDELDAHLVAYVAGQPGRNGRRRYLEARAALHRRLFDLQGAELRAAVGIDRSVSDAALWKWCERGRDVVLGALDRWLEYARVPEWVADVAAVVREAVAWRRVDAGVRRVRGAPQYDDSEAAPVAHGPRPPPPPDGCDDCDCDTELRRVA